MFLLVHKGVEVRRENQFSVYQKRPIILRPDLGINNVEYSVGFSLQMGGRWMDE